MQELFRKYAFNALIILSVASGAACGNSANAEADDSGANRNAAEIVIENVAAGKAKQTGRGAAANVSAASVAGNYEYNTVKKSVGYANSLDVEDKGAGKLNISLSGSYVYQANGAETFHEAGGEGDARLIGDTAIATVKDEENKTCRIKIVFAANRATVKVSANCHFNVALDGVYKKGKPKAVEKQPSETKSGEVAFENLAEFINDSGNHPAGEQFIVKDVPLAKIEGVWRADLNGNKRLKGLFSMDFADGGADGSGAFLTSGELVRNVQANGSSETASVRVTATLVETGGEVPRAAFLTKVEGLNENDDLLWTATGDKPGRAKF